MQGYEADSVFDEEDGFSDSYSDRRTLGRNSVQVDESFSFSYGSIVDILVCVLNDIFSV